MKSSDTILRLRIGEVVRDDGAWAEEQGFKAFLQVLTQGGGDTCQLQTSARTVNGNRITWNEDLTIEIPEGTNGIRWQFRRDQKFRVGEHNDSSSTSAGAVSTLEDMALATKGGGDLKLALLDGSTEEEAGVLHVKVQLINKNTPNGGSKETVPIQKHAEEEEAEGELEEMAKLAQGDSKKRANLLKEMDRMKGASRCFPMLLELGMKPLNVGDKVEEELSALSVVNSLLTILTFSLLSAVPDALDLPENKKEKRAYGIITATALMCNMASVVLATMLKKSMNCLIEEGGVARKYILRFSSDLTEICSFIFSLGIVLMLASILMFVYFRYDDVECYVMIAITGATFLAVVGIYLVPHRLMVTAIRKQFERKMSLLMGETFHDDAHHIWRRVWNDGIEGLWNGAGSKVKADDSPV
ncbi:hypothetical protein DUNSADRAFT_1857 [Dunaliella salina]|uniref:C2 domain-containing protein n=1 Tax=Dunaliella salina TaxID=3046 RepID=A0ABQ7GWM4_DUNSA|nr:hypothetical protein DUNSADRAFT_1857 [Dunaliella salina]|eukprot:KAF5838990.1 hypothetical protein DUNSADRAFT_1857 [Dunaliella salina]